MGMLKVMQNKHSRLKLFSGQAGGKHIQSSMLLTIASAFFYTEIKNEIFAKMLSKIVKEDWIKLELPVMVILSFLMQVLLVRFGNRQKYQGSLYVNILVWSAYLASDWLATVALSTLLRAEKRELNSELVVFWTPFLLLHLGGPPTISAYSLSDNEIWLRYLLGLFIQVGVAVYVYMRFQSAKSFPTYMAIPIFIAGIIKYGERIYILRISSSKQFRKTIFSTPPTDHVEDTYSVDQPVETSSANNQVETLDEYIERKSFSKEGKDIHKAFSLYKMSIPLFSGLKLRFGQKLSDIMTLSSTSAEDAFKVVEIELGFLYDALYTKTTILQSLTGVILRSICLSCTVLALIAFPIVVSKNHYPEVDIAITYMLLVGAIFLDIYAAIMHVLSDWTLLLVTDPNNKMHKIVVPAAVSYLARNRVKKRVASMAQHSLIDYCLNAKTSSFSSVVRVIDTEDILGKYLWTEWEPVNLDLKNFIHTTLQNKLEQYKAATLGYQDLGQLLLERGRSVLEKYNNGAEEIKWSIENVEFSHSVLLWHIATFLLYHDDQRKYSSSVLGSFWHNSKLLSDYMMHLLLVRPSMLPEGIGEVRIKETRKEVFNFFNEETSLTHSNAASALLQTSHHSVMFNLFNRTRSKSVMYKGCRLASELQGLVLESHWDHEDKWKMIAEVWMEMFLFAANQCEWKEHTYQLKNGGEVLTHVALLMAQFGLTEQIQIVDSRETPSVWNWEQLSQLAYHLV